MNYATMSTGKAANARAKVVDEVVASEESETGASQSSGSDAALQSGEHSEQRGAGSQDWS